MARIYDAVYGYIELDEVEFALVTSPIFQRLHWIKQLGPLHTVFPSAQHSRFSHSVGVFHIMKKMINHLDNVDSSGYGDSIPKHHRRILKLAALLHDVGHVPLSHVGENVLRDTYGSTMATPSIEAFDREQKVDWKLEFADYVRGESTKLHECLSAEIVLNNKGIDTVLSKVWRGHNERRRIKEQIAEVIVGKPADQVMRALMHSELDADRLDYLLRDSFFAGVGYGHVDLDYIISRITVAENSEGVQTLCFEDKGLHTLEHYILGRFFLHTQVIFNRKVRFVDLLFADVMKYMMMSDPDKEWHLMNLKELLLHLRKDERENLHAIYAYTDAQVFSKMRQLHEDLDLKEKNGQASEEEAYINDCTKTIMDGDFPEALTRQKLVPLVNEEDIAGVRKLRSEAKKFGEKLAEERGIYRKRIKVDIASQKVMKHTRREEEEDEQDRQEAVKIVLGKPGMPDRKVIPAAESNATILKDLVDKTLIVLNVYYVQAKNEGDEQTANRTNVIKAAYESWAQPNFPA